MDEQPRSLAAHIEELAKTVGASSKFVEKVRTIFSSKGISLDVDGAQYHDTLESVFQRQQTIQESTAKARESLARIQRNMDKLQNTYQKHLDQLRSLKDTMEAQVVQVKGVFRLNHAPVQSETSYFTISGCQTVFTEPQRLK